MTQLIKNSIQEARTNSHITQEDLGRAVGVTRQTIIAIERGNYTPSVLLALKLAHYFHKKVDELFAIEE